MLGHWRARSRGDQFPFARRSRGGRLAESVHGAAWYGFYFGQPESVGGRREFEASAAVLQFEKGKEERRERRSWLDAEHCPIAGSLRGAEIHQDRRNGQADRE